MTTHFSPLLVVVEHLLARLVDVVRGRFFCEMALQIASTNSKFEIFRMKLRDFRPRMILRNHPGIEPETDDPNDFAHGVLPLRHNDFL